MLYKLPRLKEQQRLDSIFLSPLDLRGHLDCDARLGWRDLALPDARHRQHAATRLHARSVVVLVR